MKEVASLLNLDAANGGVPQVPDDGATQGQIHGGAGSVCRQAPHRLTLRAGERIRVLLVDDNQAVLARVASVLEPHALLSGRFRTASRPWPRRRGSAGRHRARHLDAGDVRPRGRRGVSAHAGSMAAIVFLTVHDDAEVVGAAQAAGGIGYVVKRRLVSDLPHAVSEASARRPFVSVRRA